MSRNPFRQARDRNEEVKVAEVAGAASLFADDLKETTESHSQSSSKKKKKKKKVVIKTPPRSPEEQSRKSSFGLPPSPPLPAEVIALRTEDGGESDSTDTADSDLELAVINTTRNSENSEPLQHPILAAQTSVQAPANPFARTLASTEESYTTKEEIKNAEDEKPTGPAFDVDMFKNILLNGVAPPAGLDTGKDPPNVDEHKPIAEAITRYPDITAMTIPEQLDDVSPTQSLSSSDDSLPDNYASRSMARVDNAGAQQPRAVGPETVSFESFGEEQSESTGASFLTRAMAETPEPFNPQKHDTESNKPPPLSPQHGADAVMETSALPPPPPATRRPGAHREPASGHHRSNSVLSHSSAQSEASGTPVQLAESKAPPPPPSRRAAQNRITPTSDNAVINAVHPMSPPPAPAPRRTPSKPTSPPIGRTPSSASGSSLQALAEGPVPPASTGSGPRPPPPRRKIESNRSSVDGLPLSRQTNGQESKLTSQQPSNGEGEVSRDDLLSNLAALQREVDALRAKAGS